MREVERYWDGHPAAVEESLRRAREAGLLVSWRPLPARPGQVAGLAVLRGPTPAARARPESRRRRHAGRWWAAGLAAAGTVTIGVGWLVWQALVWLAGHLEAIAGGIALLVGLWWVLGQLGACPGVHCPGCRHG